MVISFPGSAFGHVMFSRRPSETYESSCAFSSLQSSCRQQTFRPERPAMTTALNTSSSLNLTTHPYMHNLPMNSLKPLTTTSALSHPCHNSRPLPHPGYINHPNEHTIHHTPSHLTARVHSTLDCRPEYGLVRSDYSKPLTISTTFHHGFQGTPPAYPYHWVCMDISIPDAVFTKLCVWQLGILEASNTTSLILKVLFATWWSFHSNVLFFQSNLTNVRLNSRCFIVKVFTSYPFLRDARLSTISLNSNSHVHGSYWFLSFLLARQCLGVKNTSQIYFTSRNWVDHR